MDKSTIFRASILDKRGIDKGLTLPVIWWKSAEHESGELDGEHDGEHDGERDGRHYGKHDGEHDGEHDEHGNELGDECEGDGETRVDMTERGTSAVGEVSFFRRWDGGGMAVGQKVRYCDQEHW